MVLTLAYRIMAPVLRTLTVSYSDDTIYALAVTLSFLHLAFHDYSYANTTASGHFQVRNSTTRNEWGICCSAERVASPVVAGIQQCGSCCWWGGVFEKYRSHKGPSPALSLIYLVRAVYLACMYVWWCSI